MSYIPIGRSPYVNNPQCEAEVLKDLKNGVISESEFENIKRICNRDGGLLIFDKIYNAVKDGKLTEGEFFDILQTPGGSSAVGSLLKTILNIFDILQRKINDGKLTRQEYSQFIQEIERQGTLRGSSASNVDIHDIIGRLLLSAINTNVPGFPKPSQYNNQSGNQYGGKKQSKGSKRVSKKSSKKGSKKGGAKKTSKKGSKKMIKKGSKKSKA